MYIIKSRFNGIEFRTQVGQDGAGMCGRLYKRGHTCVRIEEVDGLALAGFVSRWEKQNNFTTNAKM